MSRAIRPEEAFELELGGATSPLGPSDLMDTVALLRAAGHRMQAPASLYGRRGALLEMSANSGLRSWPAAWRRSRAMLLAAGLSALTAAAVGAATMGSGWLADTRPPVRMVLPPVDELDATEYVTRSPTPSPIATEVGDPDAMDIVEPRGWSGDAAEPESGYDSNDDEDFDDEPESGDDSNDDEDFDDEHEDGDDDSDGESGDDGADTNDDSDDEDGDTSESDDGESDDSGDDGPDTDDADTSESDDADSDEADSDEADAGGT